MNKKNFLLFLLVLASNFIFAQGGPSQPECVGFKPIGVSENVNHFTGDFTHTIPLLDIEGFPLNLNYMGNVSHTEEASWVGLGWNLNIGTINRQMRGIPDEFNGTDFIIKEFSTKPNITAGINIGANMQIFNWQPMKRKGLVDSFKVKLGASLGLFYNNYNGWGHELSISPSFSLHKGSSGSLTGGLSLKSSTESGLDITPSLGLDSKTKEAENRDKSFLSVGASINSREGLKSLNFGISVFQKVFGKHAGSLNYSHSMISGSYNPTINMDMSNNMFALSINVDGTLYGFDGGLSAMGHFSIHQLKKKKVSKPLFGYMYSELGKDNEYAILDFNREKDIAYNENVPTIAVPNMTYDYFNVNEPDNSGYYRVFKNSSGIVFDPKGENSTFSGNLGFEIGAGNIIQIGGTINVTTGGTVTKKWNTLNNKYKGLGDFALVDNSINKVAESFYFKNLNENILTNENLFNQIKANTPISVSLGGDGTGSFASRLFKDNNNNLISINNEIKDIATGNVKENLRKSNFTFITKKERSFFGFEKKIYSYSGLGMSCNNRKEYSNINSKDHHISEIIVVNGDGRRHVYGIPVYNNFQKEVTFAISGIFPDINEMVAYSNEDASIDNDRGIDHYYNAETMPAYPHSWLLTSLLSSDYQDLTGDGISDDDQGTAYKFNYTLKNDNYQWRNPSTNSQKANYNVGLYANPDDDKASYIYGTREEWYIHSIESKNMIAFFHLSERKDARGVKEHGGIDNLSKKFKLDSISLYTKSEINIKGFENSVPIKVVKLSFDESYPLCKGVENTIDGAGKLTLKSVAFSFQKSVRSALNKYSFKYANNPNFKWKNVDRWGNYKEESENTLDNQVLKTSEFPYTLQDKAKSDKYAGAWLVSEIITPSGATIKIEYEADDYAYVQNKRASYMAPILGLGNSPNSGITSDLYNKKLFGTDKYDYLFFKFSDNAKPPINRKDLMYKWYFDDPNNLDYLKNVYYRAKVKMFPGVFAGLVNSIINGLFSGGDKEYVPGYLEIEDYGIRDNNTGWIKVKQTEGNNPISFAAWQLAKTQMPKKAYPWSNLGEAAGPLSLIMAVPTFLTNLSELILGYDELATRFSLASSIEPEKSYIKLLKPDNIKIGGGSRVKRITINDNWSSMISSSAGNKDAVYGQEYSYKKEENGQTISSGVAEYEPLQGGDENSFRKPINYSGPKGLFAPSSSFYVEEPICEGFFPSPSVGYSRVEVKSINSSSLKSAKSGTGKQVYEFYTAKDFPVITDRTYLGNNIKRFNPNFFASFLKIDNRTGLFLSQGFYVETNDMHGKPMSEKNYNQLGTLISETKYEYKIDGGNKISSYVPSIDVNGQINPKTMMGLTYDFYTDMRRQKTSVLQVDAELGGGFFMIGIFPIPHFGPFPPFGVIENEFYSSSSMKHVIRRGILNKVYKMQDGSSVTTDNLVWDKNTGEPVVTKITNEYNDPIYNVKYPAFWKYKEMDFSYFNMGLEFNEQINNGVIPPNMSKYLNNGDEMVCIINGQNIPVSLWVLENPSIPSERFLINRNGYKFTGTGFFKIVRTGKRNLISQQMFSASMLKSPLNNDQNPTSLSFNQYNNILNAEGTFYSDKWKIIKNAPIYKLNGCLGIEKQILETESNSILDNLRFKRKMDEWLGCPKIISVPTSNSNVK